jgi:hypothetical protein
MGLMFSVWTFFRLRPPEARRDNYSMPQCPRLGADRQRPEGVEASRLIVAFADDARHMIGTAGGTDLQCGDLDNASAARILSLVP